MPCLSSCCRRTTLSGTTHCPLPDIPYTPYTPYISYTPYTPYRVHNATFDKIDFVINFRAGKDGLGAVIKSFKSAIFRHDECVVRIEQKYDEIMLLKRDLSKKSRLFRNLDSAWNAVQEDNAIAFAEYTALRPKVRNAEERLKVLKDVKMRAKLEANYNRYLELHPKCENQLVILETYNEARQSKDEALKLYIEANKELSALREEEKIAASFISDDHVLADTQRKTLQQLFQNVQVGHIMISINGENVENTPYNDVVTKLRTAKPPHKAEFKRYDYRYNPFENAWNSLQELRDEGVCVEDPMIQVTDFIRHAAAGDIAAIKTTLLQGEDPNCKDYTGASPLLMACVNNHERAVELLIKAGAEVNTRDKNMMTPILFCISRGHLNILRILISYGADKYAADKNDRNGVYYAVLSGSENMIKFFLRPQIKNKPDALWGFTPLHLAASQGNVSGVRSLLNYGCSIYSQDKKGKTPEDVAEEHEFVEIKKMLVEERASAPAQMVMYDKLKEVKIWIGDKARSFVIFLCTCSRVFDVKNVMLPPLPLPLLNTHPTTTTTITATLPLPPPPLPSPPTPTPILNRALWMLTGPASSTLRVWSTSSRMTRRSATT